jgi:hypothetical protein
MFVANTSFSSKALNLSSNVLKSRGWWSRNNEFMHRIREMRMVFGNLEGYATSPSKGKVPEWLKALRTRLRLQLHALIAAVFRLNLNLGGRELGRVQCPTGCISRFERTGLQQGAPQMGDLFNSIEVGRSLWMKANGREQVRRRGNARHVGYRAPSPASRGPMGAWPQAAQSSPRFAAL